MGAMRKHFSETTGHQQLIYGAVVGMTSQVSDVVVSSRQRRHLTLMHSIVAFAFNMPVLALSINVMAGAIYRPSE
jgi:uncharacterized membrane protein